MAEQSNSIAIVNADDVEWLAELLQAFDQDIYTLLREAKIPNDILTGERDYQHLPEAALKNVLELMERSASREEMTLLFWSFCKQVYVPKFVAQLSKQTSLKEVLDEFSEHLKTRSTGATLYTKNTGGKWWLVREKTFSNAPWFKLSELFSVLFINELLTSLTQGQWRSSEVGIQSDDLDYFQALPEMAEAQFFVGRPVTAFAIPESLIHSPITLSKNTLAKSTSSKDRAQSLNQALNMPTETCSFLSSFKLAIKPYLSMGKLPISLASEILNIHVRTIQRRLEKEGVVYKTLIEEMVLEQTLYLLQHSSLSITEIGAKMGYSDSSHFTRAFKRQMKMTPRQFRQENPS